MIEEMLSKGMGKAMFCQLLLYPYSHREYLWVVLAHKTIGQAVGDWYFDRSTFREIETDHIVPWNCNHMSDDELKKRCTPRSHSGSTKISRSDINILLFGQISE
ncbi:hypothetical protein C2S53_004840 [Perilla frutescens var. hirtella]|uniref:Uncharacterized protein n=1 Tax=Perilla frutescens var. hirtella TaxID=608512 RepID=A0AAD4PBQ3_PERFH|nr:hypothetical protein C2S53_004840 [Perilla frutescens var. hirtella]